jgi:hypothetical protein
MGVVMDVAVAWILIWQVVVIGPSSSVSTGSQGFHDRPSCEMARKQIEEQFSYAKAVCTPWYRQAPDQDETN